LGTGCPRHEIGKKERREKQLGCGYARGSDVGRRFCPKNNDRGRNPGKVGGTERRSRDLRKQQAELR